MTTPKRATRHGKNDTRSSSTPSRKATRVQIRPPVSDDDVIVISSSDSDGDPILLPSKPNVSTTTRSKKDAIASSSSTGVRDEDDSEQESFIAKPKRGLKRALAADEDGDEERERLRKKSRAMQAETQRTKGKLAAVQKEVKRLKKELQGYKTEKQTLVELRQDIECEICLEPMWKSWALSDCGHVFCETCLLNLFKAKKFDCPTCRTRVKHRPVQIFALKSIIRAIGGPAPPGVDDSPEGVRIWDPIWPPVQRPGRAGTQAHPHD